MREIKFAGRTLDVSDHTEEQLEVFQEEAEEVSRQIQTWIDEDNEEYEEDEEDYYDDWDDEDWDDDEDLF